LNDDADALAHAATHAAQRSAAPGRFTRTSIVLHWLIALLLLGQLAFGWLVLDAIPRNTPARGFWVNQHKSVGLVIGLLILLRIYWRLRHRPPPAVPMPAWQRRAASASHLALYICMVLMPLSGYLASNFSKYGIKLFNVVRLAPWGSDDKAIYAFLNQTHAVTAIVLALLIVVHVLAVVKHMWIDRDHLLRRMWLR
jgi:cytochrome b561